MVTCAPESELILDRVGIKSVLSHQTDRTGAVVLSISPTSVTTDLGNSFEQVSQIVADLLGTTCLGELCPKVWTFLSSI